MRSRIVLIVVKKFSACRGDPSQDGIGTVCINDALVSVCRIVGVGFRIGSDPVGPEGLGSGSGPEFGSGLPLGFGSSGFGVITGIPGCSGLGPAVGDGTEESSEDSSSSKAAWAAARERVVITMVSW